MSISNPNTLDEWYEYVQSIPEEKIVDKAYAANSLSFIKQLAEEGYEAMEVEHILRMFAQRLEDFGLFVPDGGEGFYLSYVDLLEGEDQE